MLGQAGIEFNPKVEAKLAMRVVGPFTFEGTDAVLVDYRNYH